MQKALGDIAERLTRCGAARPLGGQVITPALVLIQQPRCGAWAFNTAVATIIAVREMLPQGWPQWLTFGLGDLLEPIPLPDHPAQVSVPIGRLIAEGQGGG